MSTFVGRTTKWSRVGRVNSENMFAFNKKKKDEAIEEKSFWSLNKDSHPINHWSFTRWAERKRKEDLFEQRINTLPPDQMVAQKWTLTTLQHLGWLLPVGVVVYTALCYVRYQVFGVTPADASLGITRFLHGSARPPVH